MPYDVQVITLSTLYRYVPIIASKKQVCDLVDF